MKSSLALLFTVFCCNFIYSQGIISGTLLDENTGEALMFANVYVEGDEQLGGSTDMDGKYTFDAPEGMYTLVFSYIGYQDKTVTDVEVKSGEVTYLDVVLSDNAVLLAEDVVITARKVQNSEIALMAIRKNSDVIQDNYSSAEMRKFNISDAAGALKKVTGTTISNGKYVYVRGLGDRYSLSQLNGIVIPSSDPYRNGAQLDLIPTNFLDNIITSKTFTPDQPGNFTGGNVNIQTKDFPETFTMTFSASAGYNTQNNLINNFLAEPDLGNDYWGYGKQNRELPSVLLSDKVEDLGILNQSLSQKPRDGEAGSGEIASLIDQSIRSMNNDFTPDQVETPLDHGFGISLGNQFDLGGDMKLGLTANAAFKQEYRHLDRFQKANWQLRDINSNSLHNLGDFEETNSTQTPSLNGMLGLALRLAPGHTIKSNVLYSHTADKVGRSVEGERPDNLIDPLMLIGRSISFREREMRNLQFSGKHVFTGLNNLELDWNTSFAQLSSDEPDTRFFEYQYNTETEESIIPASNIQIPFHFWRDLDDKQQAYKLDLTYPANDRLKLKMGGLYTNKDRTFSEYRYQTQRETWFITQGQIFEFYNADAFDGDIDAYLSDSNIGDMGSLPSEIAAQLPETEEERQVLGLRMIDVTVPRNSYDGSERIAAGYIMGTYKFSDKLKAIGGLRYEDTDINVASRDTFLDIDERVGEIKSGDFLPSMNIVYSPRESMNIRASFTKTLARPNLREIAPFTAFDPLIKETYFGNAQLDKTDITNYDLRWEWFPSSGEVFAISAYYKDFQNPITLFYRKAPNPEIQYTNVPSANLFGLEFEVKKNLEFINYALRNVKFSTNVALIESSSDARQSIDSDVAERPFEGQAPIVANTALIYSDAEKGIDAVLSWNMIGDRLKIIGREGTPDIYERGRSQLDFSLSYKIGDVGIRFSAQNLLDSPFILSSEFKGNEYTYVSYKRGITYGLGLNYTLR